VGRRHVNGIYFTGGGDDVQQWARVGFQVGIRTVPAGSLQFVDFSKPDPGAERVQRFMTAAKHALAEGDFALAAQRLVYARDAEPRKRAVLRLLTTRVLAGRRLSAAARAVRDWIARGAASARRRTATPRASTRTWARSRRPSTRRGARSRARRPTRPRGSGSDGCGCGTSTARRARGARGGARAADRPSRAPRSRARGALWADVGAEVSACEQATDWRRSPGRVVALAHALARTDRLSDCLEACERALALEDDPEVRNLREQVLAAAPRELGERAAA
jgi:hypothetical protein